MITLDLSILNQKGTPMFNSDIFANRPTFGIAGRIFISTDTLAIYRDTGSAWDLLGGGGGTISGTIAAGQVAFGTAANTIGGENNLFWDSTNDRLGIGTNTPADAIEINKNFGGGLYTRIRNTNAGIGSVAGLNLINDAIKTGGIYLFSSLFTPNGTRGPNTLTLFSGPDTNISVAVNSTGYYSIGTGSTETEKFRIFNNGNVLIQDGGTFTDGGQRLQVVGSSLLNGDVTFSSPTGMFWDSTNVRLGIGTNTPTNILDLTKSQNNPTAINITNATSNTNARAGVSLISNTGNGQFSLQKYSTLHTAYKINAASDGILYNDTAGDISVLNDFTTGKIKFSAGGSSTAQITLFSTGNLAIGTTTDNGFRLDVNGTAEIKGRLNINTTSNCELTFINGSTQSRWANNTSAPYIGTLTSHPFLILTAATERIRIFINGNINVGSTTDNGEKFQVTGTSAIRDTQSYTTGTIQSFAIVKNLTINAAISGSSGICNYVSTGDNGISSSQSVPASTSFANIYAFNKYQFNSAGLTLTATQAAPGVRTISQLFTQNVFKGANSGTITHMSGVQIGGYYNDNTGTITPIIPNAYQLLINDTGAYGHTFTFTNRWGIYQEGINDRNYLAGNLMLNSTTDTGQILQVTGAIRVNGQSSGTAGVSSGNYLIINVDGTSYKIALLNP
jgi:hypothetical protein